MTLFDETRAFLAAVGYSVDSSDSRAGVVRGDRAAIGDTSDQITVWCPSYADPEELRRNEAGLLRRFATDTRSTGKRFLLVESIQGLSSEFRSEARTSFSVQTRVPVQFFDAPFRWEAPG